MKRVLDDSDPVIQKQIKRLREEGQLTASFDSEEDLLPGPNLSPSQLVAWDAIVRGDNVLITGEAGSGKSYLIQHIVNEFKRSQRAYELTATTGVAAWHIHGITLHRFAGVGLGTYDASVLYNMIRNNNEKTERWKRVSTLIIDEISLCDTEYFEKLEVLSRKIRGNNAVFGGIQIVLVGDYFQCPPIMKGKSANAIKYLFESPLWSKLRIKIVQLKTNFRQSNDAQFRTLLEHIKLAQLTLEDCELLRTRLISQLPDKEENRIKLCSLREDAKNINLRALKQLSGEVREYKGIFTLYNESGLAITEEMLALMNKKQLEDYEKRLSLRDQPTDMEISLKVGAKVLLCCNLNVRVGLYNGSRGVVKGFRGEEGKEGGPLWPLVAFDNGETVLIMPNKWERRYYDRIECTFIQIPLLLCYAITIHKSQGLTLPNAEFEMEKFFGTGLGYVAFSRVSSLNDIYLININPKKIKTDPVVIQFYESNGLL